MDRPLNILVIEDSAADFMLVERHLRRASLDARCRRVDTLADLTAALDESEWDVVLSDYSMPAMSFGQTLELLRGCRPDLPLILISGGLGEEEAAEWLKRGAWDFVLKGGLARLVPAIERAMRDAAEHRAVREAEQAVRDGAFRMRQLIAGLPHPVWTCDPDGACDFLSERWVAYTGIPADIQLGYGWLESVHPDDQAGLMSAWNAAVAAGSDFAVEFRLRRHDGAYRWFDTRAVPLRTEDGRIEKWFGSSSDIHETREGREALRVSEARLSAIFHISPAAIAVSRAADGLFFEANETFLSTFGYQRAELIGHTAIEIGMWQNLAVRKAAVSALRSGKPVINREIRLVRKGGAVGEFLYSAALTELNGEECILSVMQDVTDYNATKHHEEELRQSNAELEQFAYVASHDLREPLRMISSYLNLLKRRLGASLDATGQEFIGYAVDGATRMDALIRDLLEYSRVGRDAVHETVSLATVLEEVRLILGPTLIEVGADLTIAEDLPSVIGYHRDIVRLFQNLIGNAVKYRHPDRAAVISVGWKDDGSSHWVAFVQDNGTGIEARDFERVFGIFQRLVPREQCEGTGIGLAVCHKIVEQHHGRIWIESVPGKGSTFFVSLPKAA
ncbi:Signal transduction histidine kinase involved in nitrogen fixation and metabolism regulation (fragment) [Magnetospirillum sp. LM-5]|uniref:ATP-binding protein n=1 Tax=Magnetospirillum sp. LM-5 TaxID=2681466 RepID=UPI00137ED40B